MKVAVQRTHHAIRDTRLKAAPTQNIGKNPSNPKTHSKASYLSSAAMTSARPIYRMKFTESSKKKSDVSRPYQEQETMTGYNHHSRRHGSVIRAIVMGMQLATVAALRDCRDTGGSFAYQQDVLFDDRVNYYAQSLVQGDDFIITLSASHDGFLGFGIAEQTSGSMLGADIVVAAIEDSGVRIRDYFADYESYPFKPYAGFVQRSPTSDPVPAGTNLRPVPDCDNGGTDDWEVLAASSDTVGGEVCQTITLKRKLVTGDSNDRPLVAGTFMRVVYAFGFGTVPVYHGSQRAGIKMWIGTPNVQEPPFECLPPACFSKEFHLDQYLVPQIETTYVNLDFKIYEDDAPDDTDEHMIYFEEITDDSTLRYLHHLVVFGCYGNSSIAELKNETYFGGPTCVTPLFIWAYGGDPLELPAEAGFSAGFASSTHVTGISINYHFTNHLGDANVIDDSGVRIYFTTDKRPHEAGVLQLGGVGNTIVPSNASEFIVQSSCRSECTKWFPNTLNVFSSFLHMHSFGKQIWTNQYDSSGNFKRVTNRIDFWNFEWQLGTPVDFTIEPGDEFQTFCIFNSTKWKDPIRFGPSSFDEMCIEYLYYWPALEEFNELAEIVSGLFDTRIEFASICSAEDFREEDPLTNCYVDIEIPGFPILPTSGLRPFGFNDSALNVEQLKFLDSEISPFKDPNFATLKPPLQCKASLVQPGGGGTNNVVDPIVIGASVAGGVLLVAAFALVLLKRSRAGAIPVANTAIVDVKA